MNTLFSVCIVAIALQVSLQDGIWPIPTPPIPQSPTVSPVPFPATSTLTLTAFCDFASKNCPRFRVPADRQLCKLAERICISDSDTSCPTKLNVCKTMATKCSAKSDPLYQDICNLEANSCGSMKPERLSTPTSTSVNTWCLTTKAACNPTDCRFTDPNCVLFKAACTANSTTEEQRTKLFCKNLFDSCGKHNGDASVLACTYYDTFQCASTTATTPKTTRTTTPKTTRTTTPKTTHTTAGTRSP